jgi:hypothetical protein
MRKGISILFALVMILSGTHLTLAKHYCGGELVDTKLSMTGKLATCGMENDNETDLSSGIEIKTHCCDNNITTIGIINNYIPSVTLKSKNVEVQTFSFHLPVNLLFSSPVALNNISANVSPPGIFPLTSVSLDDICVFRI